MASIEYDGRLDPEIEATYDLWRRAQPRGQFGSQIFTDIKGGADANNTVFRQFPDGFVDELERLGAAIKRK